ncbi:MAG: Rid family detoxifying hydrolase [Terracidiphilus sp.]
MTRNEIVTNEIAQPVGPFSAAVTTGQFLYLSGQVAQDPISGKLVPGGVAEQTEQIFKNVAAILRAAGKDLSHVVKVTVFLTDIGEFAKINEIYGRHFDKPYPARTTIAVVALPLGAQVEFDMIAV